MLNLPGNDKITAATLIKCLSFFLALFVVYFNSRFLKVVSSEAQAL